MSNALKNTSLVVASLLCGALLLEGVLRFFVTPPNPYPLPLRVAVADARGFWIWNPGTRLEMDNRTDFRGKTATFDAAGMRRVPCRTPKPERSRRRIFMIGDSQTFGFGLSDNETWPNRIQCMLNRSGPPTAVYNLGVAAINTDQYIERLPQILSDLKPGDLIVVALTWNDLATDLSRLSLDKAGRGVCPANLLPAAKMDFPPCLTRPKRFLNATETWRYRLHRATGLFVPSFESAKAFVLTLPMASALAFVTVPKMKLLWYSIRGKTALFEKLPADTFRNHIRIVARMRDRVAEKGAETQVVLLPSRVFTDDYYYRAYSKGGIVFRERDFPKYATADACRDHRLDCFSLFEALRTTEPDRFTYRYDGHLNPAGAQAVADALAQKLKERLSAAPANH